MANSSSTSSSDRGRELTALVGVVAALAAGHLLFRAPVAGAPALPERTPYEQIVMTIDRAQISDISARTRLIANGQGLRGQVLGRGAVTVLIVGGSTAQCALLDERDSLVTRVYEQLPLKQIDGRPIRIATSARGGYTLTQVNTDLASLLASDDTHANLVVAMTGGNDLEQFIAGVPWAVDASGTVIPEIPPDSPFSADHWEETYAGWYEAGSRGDFASRVRSAYMASSWSNELDARKEQLFLKHLWLYDEALVEMARITKLNGSELLLVTQPISYAGDERGPRVRSWLPYFSSSPEIGFIPSPALFAELLGRLNDHTRAFAKRSGLPLLDLDAELTGCADCFYDQWHFDISGAQVAGRLIAEFLSGPIQDL